MICSRYILVTLLISFLLQGCAGQQEQQSSLRLEPASSYQPPAGAAPTEYSTRDTGEMVTTPGHRDEQSGAEVISSETIDDEELVEIRLNIDPDQVDDVEVMTSDGDSVNLSREARIVQDYENNNVGIWIRVPTEEKAGFRLKLIDNADDSWPPMRQQ